jgi:RHS repeat-associated protein
VRQLVTTDGAVLDALTYDSYGNILDETNPENGDRFKYTGREYDAVLGMYYYRARYYAPGVGCFVSEDPLGFAGGDTNLYRYVHNRPTNATDPTGMVDWGTIGSCWGGTVSGALVGGAVGTVVGGAPTLGIGVPVGFAVGAIGGAAGGLIAGCFFSPPTDSFASGFGAGVVPGGVGGTIGGLAVAGGIVYLVDHGVLPPITPDIAGRVGEGVRTVAPSSLGVGSRAVVAPGLRAGEYPALLVDGRVYVARMHEVAWELAGRTGEVQKYGIAEIDDAGTVIRWLYE